MLDIENDIRKSGINVIAGVDEAGVGPWAGPVVACACVLRTYELKSKIADSKVLTKKQRETSYVEIVKNADIGIGIVSNDVIDKINILNAVHLAVEEALKNLTLKPQYILLDGRLKVASGNTPWKSVIDGDALCFSIACASIVAKVCRDKIMTQMDNIYPGYGFAKHNGYGTSLHIDSLRKLGPCKIHRKSFAPIARLINNDFHT